MTTRKKRILTVVLFVLVSHLSFALGGGDGTPPPPSPPPPPGLSIGVNAFFLAGLALILGIKRLLKKERINF
ncbi:hypothetical protein [Seonamhaeicola maritimus]|uniref:hypothetical protein n=1 Tax=Seonamhaeicola maritimus TaxID=2591822 RepID=UPI002493E06F|nr:hypothetical protein [Seonamhaeicola maritimus]